MMQNHPFVAGLKISLDREGRAMESTVRGWQEGEVLLIDTPGGMGDIKKSDDLDCTLYTRTGPPATFVSCMIGALPEYNLSVLSFPEKIEGASQAVIERLNVTLPVTVAKAGEGKESASAAIMTDISLSDCLLTCEKLFIAGDAIVIKGSFPGLDEPFELTGSVKNSMKAKKGGSHGVALDGKNKESLQKLERYLDQLKSYMYI